MSSRPPAGVGRPVRSREVANTPQLVIVIVLLLAAYLVVLLVRPLFIPDEVRYGEIAREMIASGDWIVPRLNGLLYFEKPPLGYWLNALSLLIFGDNGFAVRFSSLVAVAASASLVYALGRPILRDRQAALFAVIVYITTFEVYGVGTYGLLDSVFAATLNAGIAAVATALSAQGRRRLGWLVSGGICFGLGFLTKGFLAFVLPVLILAPWFALQRKSGFLIRRGWIVVFAALAVAMPWSLSIQLREPDFWHYFFWIEHVQRFAGDNAQHKAAAYYYIALLPIVAFPWIFLLPAAVRSLRRSGFSAAFPGVLSLLILWMVAPLIFFSIAHGKLVTYLLPCFVPFALLIAAGLSRMDERGGWLRAGLLGACTVPILSLVGVLWLQFLAVDVTGYAPTEAAKLGTLLVTLLACVAILCYGAYTDKPVRLLSPGLAMGFLIAVWPWIIPVEALHHKAPIAFIDDVYTRVPGDAAIVTDAALEGAVSWALKRDDIYVDGSGGETRYGLGAADARGRQLSRDDFRALIRSRNILLFCTGECPADARGLISDTASVWRYGAMEARYLPIVTGPPSGPD
ncbi:MAG: phospholipid carrier-dependent glycosyltransferase [Woeseiaceae bacterium]